MGLIFFFSTDFGSYSNTSYFIDPIVRFLVPQITPRALFLTHALIRKAAHLTVYGVLSYLWFIALSQGGDRWSPGRGLLAFVLSVFYASLDEYHQSLVRSRTATVVDVGIDSAGAFLAQLVLFLKRPSFFSDRRAPGGNR
jgi:VanZ family protein